MIELKKENFYDILFESPVGTVKETHAEVTIRIPIETRQDMYDLIQEIIDNSEIRKELEFRLKHPMAMNYLTFKEWINILLTKNFLQGELIKQ